MADSSSNKPFMVTSSLNLKVTAPSFYNQPKKFASVAPPRPKGQNVETQQSSSDPSVASTAVIGRVGQMPPLPPSAGFDDFPPPPPPLDDAELPAPPPDFHSTPPAFPDPPPPAVEELPFPAPPEEVNSVPSAPHPPPPPPPPPLPASTQSPSSNQRLVEKQTSFDRQLDTLTGMLSEMETRASFNPKLPSQMSTSLGPKPSAPPPIAPKPPLSFLPPPELQDRPPPAPWAEELRARTTQRQAHQSPASGPTPTQSLAKAQCPYVTPTFMPSNSVSQEAHVPPKAGSWAANHTPSNSKPRPSAPAVCPLPVCAPSAPSVNHAKRSPIGSQENLTSSPPQTKPMASPPSTNQAARGPGVPKPSASSGTGGVPLTMREVEELEKMTNDFIRDMDTHAPVITSAPTEVCGVCGQALSRIQPAVRAMDQLFHSQCFCCMSCQRPLQGMQFYDRDGSPQCEDCYVNSLAVCACCSERITDRVLKAVGQCFHAHCFRCTTCNCSLEGAPFITDDCNKPYCVPDYHRRFSPLCVSCNEPIVPDPGSEETVRVVALEKNFHLKCYRCEDCSRPLSIEADADGCYPLNGRILCMKCHTSRAKQGTQ
ncbi:zyxin [Denticeps clupeoides]|uniref:Zyxin n=1 Tax=Denticeps clupeoides TaxID=299321 RepID=A0AAY4A6P6_9TELE|nr:zyxin-like [Denticeps clupeoides]XP_028834000.1 zyxin-like [Denticeps clupeoides]XP_028834001.1 zyxin-like [Denticeps clupeoides]